MADPLQLGHRPSLVGAGLVGGSNIFGGGDFVSHAVQIEAAK
jgi:hypothetical protein